jgi:hypothetical protein
MKMFILFFSYQKFLHGQLKKKKNPFMGFTIMLATAYTVEISFFFLKKYIIKNK